MKNGTANVSDDLDNCLCAVDKNEMKPVLLSRSHEAYSLQQGLLLLQTW